MKHNGLVILLVGIAIIVIGVFYFNENVALQPESEEATGDTETSEAAAEGSSQVTSRVAAPSVSEPTSNAPSPGATEQAPQDKKTVTYTNAGFEPPVLQIEAGDVVRFVNESNKSMWITSSYISTGESYPALDQGKSVSAGGTFTFAFTLVGTWSYKNLNSGGDVGTIVVLPQSD